MKRANARWRRRGSNPPPSVCQTDALPTELRPLGHERRRRAGERGRADDGDSGRTRTSSSWASAKRAHPLRDRVSNDTTPNTTWGDRRNRTCSDSGHDRAYGPPYDHRSGDLGWVAAARRIASQKAAIRARNSNLFGCQSRSPTSVDVERRTHVSRDGVALGDPRERRPRPTPRGGGKVVEREGIEPLGIAPTTLRAVCRTSGARSSGEGSFVEPSPIKKPI